ncbi:hypothetical protein V5799_007413 [Amblyomma americanum]|uniref:Uncharacterized protein n=1 Tax=Amblyomma americanum TaxID=6943 RepID=A0AAQ4FGG8_AMBAM
MIAPKKRALGEKTKQPLMPQKVNIVTATIKHWGATKGIDMSDIVRSVPRLLMEKIQDVKKALWKTEYDNSMKE